MPLNKLHLDLHYLTDNRLLFVSFSQHNIAKIVQNLNQNKAHDHDNISMCMLKVCGSSIYKPLKMIFKQHIKTSVFLSEKMKKNEKGNIVSIHKKGDKQALKNYRPFKFQCSKIQNQMILALISFLFITHEIYESFDVGLEVRSVYLDISKAFDKKRLS